MDIKLIVIISNYYSLHFPHDLIFGTNTSTNNFLWTIQISKIHLDLTFIDSAAKYVNATVTQLFVMCKII